VTGRTWRGSAFGGVKGRTELPALVDGELLIRHNTDKALIWTSAVSDYLSGKMQVDEYVTHERTLGSINGGFHDMHVRR